MFCPRVLLALLVCTQRCIGEYTAEPSESVPKVTDQVWRWGPDGWQNGYILTDGTISYTRGVIGPGGSLSVIGQFGFRSPGGSLIGLEYTADRRGYLPRGGLEPIFAGSGSSFNVAKRDLGQTPETVSVVPSTNDIGRTTPSSGEHESDAKSGDVDTKDGQNDTSRFISLDHEDVDHESSGYFDT